MLIAHRGCSGRYPENTLRAFREALKLPVDGIELDVRRTRDGVLVVIHDETVDRTTFGSGRVSELTWDELRQLDAGAWKGDEFAGECIPRFEEVLELVKGQTVLHVEIKEVGTETQIAETLRHYDAERWVKLASFHPEAVASARRAAPETAGVLIGGLRVGNDDATFQRFVHTALQHGASAVSVHYSVATPQRVRYCHQRYLFVGVWTVNDADLARQLVAMGVDAIASDYPERILAALPDGAGQDILQQ
jgi:glycerophosphoryl diester phosphodiesterase